MEQEEKFSDDPEENLRIENELMKIKLQAQFGDAFQMESSEGMPPEMENQFLKNIIAFEASYTKGDFITVYERIGKPDYKVADNMNTDELQEGVAQLLKLLEQHQVNLDFSEGPYDDATVYRFITEELFNQEVDREPIEGMLNGFIYEEFHPNHKAIIEKTTHEFFREWFTQNFTDTAWLLNHAMITPEGEQIERKQLLEKMRLFFDAFKHFSNDGYNIDNSGFELQEGESSGTGFAEGTLKYDAAIENNEVLHFEGPYKLYFQLQEDEWSIYYFVMPGFKW